MSILKCQFLLYDGLRSSTPHRVHEIFNQLGHEWFGHPVHYPQFLSNQFYYEKLQSIKCDLVYKFLKQRPMDSQQYGSQQSDRMAKPKSSTKHLQLHVASVYSEIAQMIKQRADLEIEMPAEVPTAVERVNLIKSVLAYLLDQTGNPNAPKQESCTKKEPVQIEQNNLDCINCENYEKNLQKLEGQIRNHIRTHQQLKLYQDGLEQKIEQLKKQKKEFDKKYESTRKKYEEAKSAITGSTDKFNKLQQQNERLRNQVKQLRIQACKVEEPRKQLNRYESNKQNLCEWKNANFNQRERTSIEKRPDSSQRMRVSINVKSTKGIPISSKIVQEKTKEEKAKVLKTRLGF